MSLIFPIQPLTDAEATETQSQYQAAIDGLSYAATVKKYLWPAYVTPLIPDAYSAIFDGADEAKKQQMVLICQEVLADPTVTDFNTAYTARYVAIYG